MVEGNQLIPFLDVPQLTSQLQKYITSGQIVQFLVGIGMTFLVPIIFFYTVNGILISNYLVHVHENCSCGCLWRRLENYLLLSIHVFCILVFVYQLLFSYLHTKKESRIKTNLLFDTNYNTTNCLLLRNFSKIVHFDGVGET